MHPATRQAHPCSATKTRGDNAKGQVDYVEDAAGNRTSFVYDEDTGRRIETIDALSNSVYTAYDVQGRVTNTWGGTYPVAYRYDDFGRMSAMLTWRDASGSPDTTLWQYDEATGLLTNKVYADDNGRPKLHHRRGSGHPHLGAGHHHDLRLHQHHRRADRIDYGDQPRHQLHIRPVGRQYGSRCPGTRTFAYDPATLTLTNETIVATA